MTRMAADSLARLSCPAVDLITQPIHSVTVLTPFTPMLPDIEFKGLRYGQLLTDTHHRSVVPSIVLEKLDCFPLPFTKEGIEGP